jgi:hypothetical protein
MARVVTREYQKDDSGLVVSTWTKYAWKDRATEPGIPRKVWMKEHYVYVCRALEEGYIKIACLSDDPSTILGYSVVLDGKLQWVYVKPEFVGLGIGRILEVCIPVSEIHMTKRGREILNNRKEKRNGKESFGDSNPDSAEQSAVASDHARNPAQTGEVPPSSH